MRARIFQVDAFTTRRFAGNPAAVMPMESFPDDVVLQAIAAENNLAETAFLVPEDPVTGGAHCALALYWAKRLSQTVFRAYQASERGGEIVCRVAGDRIELEGSCVFHLEGEVEI